MLLVMKISDKLAGDLPVQSLLPELELQAQVIGYFNAEQGNVMGAAKGFGVAGVGIAGSMGLAAAGFNRRSLAKRGKEASRAITAYGMRKKSSGLAMDPSSAGKIIGLTGAAAVGLGGLTYMSSQGMLPFGM